MQAYIRKGSLYSLEYLVFCLNSMLYKGAFAIILMSVVTDVCVTYGSVCLSMQKLSMVDLHSKANGILGIGRSDVLTWP